MSTQITQELFERAQEEAKKRGAFEGDFKKFTEIVSSIPPAIIYQGDKVVCASLKDTMRGQATAVGFAVIDKGKIDCIGVEGQLRFQDPMSPPVTTQSLFATASICKSVTAYGALRCLADLKIDIDSPIDKYFPPVPTSYPFSTIAPEKITGDQAAKIIASEKEPAKQLEFIAQFKAWQQHTNSDVNLDEVNKLEQAILKEHEFLYGSLEIRQTLQKFTGHGITFRQLMEHSSGIVEIFPKNTERFTTSTQISTAMLTDAKVARKPGETWAYSNVGFILIECLLEQLTGKPFPTVMQQYVFDPLKMQNSTFSQSTATLTDTQRPVVNGQKVDGTSFPHEMIPRGPGGMHTTFEDYSIFMLELIRVYHAPSTDPVKEMFKEQKRKTVEGLPCNYGLGVHLFGNPKNQCIDHTGGSPSCSSIMHIDLMHQQAAVVMVNCRRDELCHRVEAAIGRTYNWSNLRELRLEPKVLLPIPEKDFSQYVGRYKMWQAEVTILVQDHRLMMELPWPTYDAPLEKLQLAKDEDGNLILHQTDGRVFRPAGKLEPIPLQPQPLAKEEALSQEQDNEAEEILKTRNYPGLE